MFMGTALATDGKVLIVAVAVALTKLIWNGPMEHIRSGCVALFFQRYLIFAGVGCEESIATAR